jgi:hypothetical protein
LEHASRLNIIIFDEIHKVLTDHSYREPFLNFWVLNLVKTAIIGLDGSLPPECLPEFFSLTHTSWRVIRTPSNRLELGYEIQRVSGDLIDKIAHDIPGLLSQYKKDDRLMVFCRTHNDVDRLSGLLKVPPFTSHTAESNTETMKKWTQGDKKVMVSTSILGCGLDYPSVRHVVHCGIAYSMIDQHQQESRAGRDGQPATAVTYVSATQKPLGGNSAYGLRELQRWASNLQQCLRIIQSQYLDGVGVTCSLLPGCTLCAYCSDQLHAEAPPQPQSLLRAPSLTTAPLQPLRPQPVFTKATVIPNAPSFENFSDSEPIHSDPISTQA